MRSREGENWVMFVAAIAITTSATPASPARVLIAGRGSASSSAIMTKKASVAR